MKYKNRRVLLPLIFVIITRISILLLFLSVLSKIVTGQTSSPEDVTYLLGMDLDEAAEQFGLRADPGCYIAGQSDDPVTLWGRPGVFLVEISDSDRYSLCGIHPLMDRKKAQSVLYDQGFEPTRTKGVYVLRSEGWYVNLNGMVSQKSISVRKAYFPDPEGKTDLAVYLGKTMQEAETDFPDLACEKETLCDGENSICYTNGLISFQGNKENDGDDYIITQITITSEAEDYCLDGFTPDVLPFHFEENAGPGQSMGSGEWADPLYAVIASMNENTLYIFTHVYGNAYGY